jgi:stage IV sporulation protein A
MTISTKEIEQILTDVLYEFSVNEYCFTVPEWITILDDNDTTKNEVYQAIYFACNKINKMSDTSLIDTCLNDCAFIDSISVKNMDLAKGCVSFEVQAIKTLFYEKLSDYCGMNITDEGCLMDIMKDFSSIKLEYNRISTALEQVRQTGYGIIMPTPHELTLEKPEIIKQGGKSGVKLKASAPSIHLIRADIETEINPIVGSEKQSEDLVKYLLSEFEDAPDKIWETNIFGKSLSELVNEGLNNKLYKMPEDARAKLRHTLERVINEGNGGLICIIL